MKRVLLVTNNTSLYSSAQQLAMLLGAELFVSNNAKQIGLPLADLLLWHTTIPYDKTIYSQLAEQFPRILLLSERGRGERLGAGVHIDVPYLVLPFEPDEAVSIVNATSW